MPAVAEAGALWLVLASLCTSVVVFCRDSTCRSDKEAHSIRVVAALSGVAALILFLILYSGAFYARTLAALAHFHASASLISGVGKVLDATDKFFTDLTNHLNVFTSHVGYRPSPPAWPVALVVVGYLVRFLIYRLHARRGNEIAALNGAAYWSHITTLVLAIAFFVLIVGWSPILVLPGTAIVLVAFFVSLRHALGDLLGIVETVANTAWTGLYALARYVVWVATELGAAVRLAVRFASKAYIEHVSDPLRRFLTTIEERNAQTKARAAQRLQDQDVRHRTRFGSTRNVP